MSAVNTGIPAAFALRIAGPTPLESTGQTTIASTFRARKSSICDVCLPRSKSAVVTTSSYPAAAAPARNPSSRSR